MKDSKDIISPSLYTTSFFVLGSFPLCLSALILAFTQVYVDLSFLTQLKFTIITPVTVLKYTERMSPWRLLLTTHLKQGPIHTIFIIIFYLLRSDVSAHDKNLPVMVLLVACNIIFS